MRLGERRLTRSELRALAQKYCAWFPIGSSSFFAPGDESGSSLSKFERSYFAPTHSDDWVESYRRTRWTLDDHINHRGRYTPPNDRRTSNRHDCKRWLRKFRVVAAVAHDALLSDERGCAIGVLTELLQLEDAVRLCSRPRTLSDYVDIKITPTLDLAGESTLYPDAPHGNAVQQALGEWFLNPDAGVPYNNDGIPLLQEAIQNVLTAAEMQRAASSEELDLWARDWGGLSRGPGETDDELRARLRAHLMRENTSAVDS